MTPDILQSALGCTSERADAFAQPISETMSLYLISTPERQAAFLAQAAVETEGLQWLHELWGPTEQQKKYDPPGELAKELGNTEVGDGFKYRGRGIFQIIGKSNYQRIGDALHVDFVGNPDLVSEPYWACVTAGYFWQQNSLNVLADRGNFGAITRRINGGLTAESKRVTAWNHCKKLLGVK